MKGKTKKLTEWKKKLQRKDGFTLAELLIVVAIIAVLAAIAIPIFNSQLTKSKKQTAIANLRSAYAEASAAYLTDEEATDGLVQHYKGESEVLVTEVNLPAAVTGDDIAKLNFSLDGNTTLAAADSVSLVFTFTDNQKATVKAGNSITNPNAPNSSSSSSSTSSNP